MSAARFVIGPLVRVSALGILSFACCGSIAQYVTLEGRKFMDGGSEFYPRVLNYHFQLASNVNGSSNPADVYCSPESVYDKSTMSELECDSWTTCNAQLQTHFTKIVNMGFNTIRAWFDVSMRLQAGNRYYSMHIRYRDGEAWEPNDYYHLDLVDPDFTDAVSERYFEILLNILDQAEAAGLKVILVCCHPRSSVSGSIDFNPAWDIAAVHSYSAYLARLAEELQGHPALLAYDLWNEPSVTNANMMNWTKGDICDFTSEWFDALNANDPNHLVTLGGSQLDCFNAWDPSAMKLDFYSVHLYPGPWSHDGYSLATSATRFKDQLYWWARTCPMPFMIGETGFSAEDDTDDHVNSPGNEGLDANPLHHQMPWMHGDETEQADFAQMSMDATRGYLGSGYSWWEFQNIRDYSLNNVPAVYRENFFGPLKYGDDVTSWFDKEVVSTFENYVLPSAPSNLPAPPSNYDNWYNFIYGALNHSWYMKDQADEAIVDGIVLGAYGYWDSDNDYAFTLYNSVVSDGNGRVTIRGSIPISGHYVSIIDLRVKIPGSIPVMYSTALGNWPADESDVNYEREGMHFDEIIDGLDVSISAYEDVKGWNSIHSINAVIQGDGTNGGAADFHARQYIHLEGEFSAEKGSEVHIWPEETFPDCGSGAYRVLANEDGGETSLASTTIADRSSQVEIQFSLDEEERFAVFPNPCREEVTVRVSEQGVVCILYNSDGAKLLEQSIEGFSLRIPMESYSAGDYLVQCRLGKHIYSQVVTKLK